MTGSPGSSVLAAFGLEQVIPQTVDGGQGFTWLAADVVLKPVSDLVEANWVAAVLDGLSQSGFRIGRPLPSRSGAWVVEGWAAWEWVEGEHDYATRWPDVLVAGRLLNRALKDIPKPSFLESRQNFWSIGDRMAWEDRPLVVIHDELRNLVDAFAGLRRPCRMANQVIHGDLTGNVLFRDPEPPAFIDFAPYWRPSEFALAIVVADAIAWHGASPELVAAIDGESSSLLARAAIFRLIASDRYAASEGADVSAYLAFTSTSFQRLLEAVATEG